MAQTAIVTRILSDGKAEISLLCQKTCGLSCNSGCDGCTSKVGDERLATANNAPGVWVGAVVTVQPNHCGSAWAAGLVFLLPCVGMVIGYLCADWLCLSRGICIVSAFLGTGAGFLPAILVNRVIEKKKTPEFTITSITSLRR
ncbi:MAG: hypothetical protein E7450_02780 [Ruminococcaceae bacterium]|nr:hypothetical protein [Oscillospiraceae bacterium]